MREITVLSKRGGGNTAQNLDTPEIRVRIYPFMSKGRMRLTKALRRYPALSPVIALIATNPLRKARRERLLSMMIECIVGALGAQDTTMCQAIINKTNQSVHQELHAQHKNCQEAADFQDNLWQIANDDKPHDEHFIAQAVACLTHIEFG